MPLAAIVAALTSAIIHASWNAMLKGKGARDRITAELRKAPQFFAYPYGGPGEVGDVAPKIVAKANFEAAFGLNRMLLGRLEHKVTYLLPRIVLHSENLSLARAYISGLPWALSNVGNRLLGRHAA